MKINKQDFKKIKRYADTPIKVKPPLRQIAQKFNLSHTTISLIRRFNTYEAYKQYLRDHQPKKEGKNE